jgi:hypothetical protein
MNAIKRTIINDFESESNQPPLKRFNGFSSHPGPNYNPNNNRSKFGAPIGNRKQNFTTTVACQVCTNSSVRSADVQRKPCVECNFRCALCQDCAKSERQIVCRACLSAKLPPLAEPVHCTKCQFVCRYTYYKPEDETLDGTWCHPCSRLDRSVPLMRVPPPPGYVKKLVLKNVVENGEISSQQNADTASTTDAAPNQKQSDLETRIDEALVDETKNIVADNVQVGAVPVGYVTKGQLIERVARLESLVERLLKANEVLTTQQSEHNSAIESLIAKYTIQFGDLKTMDEL